MYRDRSEDPEWLAEVLAQYTAGLITREELTALLNQRVYFDKAMRQFWRQPPPD